MEFTSFGLGVFMAEVADKCVDFVLRKGKNHYDDVQVKSFRGPAYVFFRKDKFGLRAALGICSRVI